MQKTGFIVSAFLAIVCCQLNAAEPWRLEQNIRYSEHKAGGDATQMLDLYWLDNQQRRPVVVYLHGGGWAFGDKASTHLKPAFFLAHDMVFISMNYRLRWDYTLYDQASDVASVIQWVSRHSDRYGLDPERLVLLGVEAGGHLAALVGTDERYLKAVQLTPANIACIVTVDTIAFNIPALLQATNAIQARHMRLVFGEQENVLAAASPASYIKGRTGLPAFVLVHGANNVAAGDQARSFSRDLIGSDGRAIIVPADWQGPEAAEASLGKPGDWTTLALMAFIKASL